MLLAQPGPQGLGRPGIGLVMGQIHQRPGQAGNGEVFPANGLGAAAQRPYPAPPEGLIPAKGNHQGGASRPQARGRGARAPMVHHRPHLGKQPVMGHKAA